MDKAPQAGSFLYTPKEQKRLRKTLGRRPVTQPVGRAQCPYCMHIEARWRAVASAEQPGHLEIRVHCSQCQRRLVYDLPAG